MKLTKLIDKALDKFLPPGKTEPKILHEAMRYSALSGGKRIRPAILIEAAVLCGAGASEAMAAASAVEFIHTYSLIHDDLPSMDDDDYRRGKLSCHKKFGEAVAILAGDALLTLAFNILASEYTPVVAAKMIKELSSTAGSRGMVGGQALDITGSRLAPPKAGLARTVNRLKTAKLFEASAVLGAIAGRAEKRETEALREYGLNLGMAFQAADDIRDGDSETASGPTAYIQKAKAALKIFGSRSECLRKIADSVILRSEATKNL